jgi:alkylation response protein AidB-like acyl-CoA dehydrogenase
MYQEMARAGFAKALLPTEYGGTGLSTLAFAVAAEELTRVDINVPTTLLASGWRFNRCCVLGTPEQKRRFLPDFLDDASCPLASFAFTETTGGANFDTADPKAGSAHLLGVRETNGQYMGTSICHEWHWLGRQRCASLLSGII